MTKFAVNLDEVQMTLHAAKQTVLDYEFLQSRGVLRAEKHGDSISLVVDDSTIEGALVCRALANVLDATVHGRARHQ